MSKAHGSVGYQVGRERPASPQALAARGLRCLPLRVFSSSALLAVLLGLVAGCSTQKQTWQQWRAAVQGGSPSAVAGLPEVPHSVTPPHYRPPYRMGDAAVVGPKLDLAARNPDFPATHIAVVQVDVTAPSNSVHLVWSGPLACQAPIGPWRSSVGRGSPGMDCNDVVDSNTLDSYCTPKGVFPVAGFDDRLNCAPACCYVSWVIHEPRYIAIHSHTEIPFQPASHGCIRVPLELAKLIHNNSLAGVTLVHIYGTWTRPMGLRN
jgi:hypothetical protein